jgi:hypothetical protein
LILLDAAHNIALAELTLPLFKLWILVPSVWPPIALRTLNYSATAFEGVGFNWPALTPSLPIATIKPEQARICTFFANSPSPLLVRGCRCKRVNRFRSSLAIFCRRFPTEAVGNCRLCN